MILTGKPYFKLIIIGILLAICALGLAYGCAGDGKDPAGVLPDLNGITADGQPANGVSDRTIWGGWLLDIRPEDGTVEAIPWDRSVEAHYDVTGMVLKPACMNCLALDNFSFDKSAGIIDLDASLTNPSVLGGYDVRGVVLLDEWNTGRRLVSEAGLTDFWSGDPWHPDPYIIFAKESEGRYFGPGEEHSSHVTLSLPKPFNVKIPFIVDASYPGHSVEPVQIANVNVEGAVHITGYTLNITCDLIDWQGDEKGVYLDCSPLNPLAGFQAFQPTVPGSSGETVKTYELNLQYDATAPGAWLPLSEGTFELPIMALDTISQNKIFTRISVDVTLDTEPPLWTGDVGIEEVWWGSQKAIISFYPATDPSGPVLYNIYSTSDIPLIPPGKCTATGWSHYSVETIDGATYHFVVKAEDQAGNEDDNGFQIDGQTKVMAQLWEHVFTADLESNPNIGNIDMDDKQDIIFGCDDGKVYSLFGTSGGKMWEFATGGMVKSSPAIRDVNNDSKPDVVIGSNDSKIYALNLIFTEPYAFKTFTTNNMVESSPVCADVTGDNIPEVIVGSYDNFLYAFQGGSGDLLVSYDTGDPVKATPSLADFNKDNHLDILVASGGIVRAINGVNGDLLWSRNTGTGFSSGSPAIGDLSGDGTGDAIFGTLDAVYAFNVVSETMLWVTDGLTGNFDTCPALGDFTGDGVPDVAISSKYQNVYLLDGTDGSVLWVSDDEIYMPTSPTVADVNDDGVLDVVVGSADMYLRVLNGVDGMTLYERDTSEYGAVTTIPLIADVDGDGDIDIVFATESHMMFAVTTGHPAPANLDLIPWPKFMRTRSNTGNLAHPLI